MPKILELLDKVAVQTSNDFNQEVWLTNLYLRNAYIQLFFG